MRSTEATEQPSDPSIPHKVIGVAIIWNNQGKILIDRRRPSEPLGGLWEFPGGKTEPGETVEDCIKREIREELGIEIAVGKHLVTVDYAYPHLCVTLTVHHCSHLTGDPSPIECEQIRWVTLDELDSIPFLSANQQIITTLQQNHQFG